MKNRIIKFRAWDTKEKYMVVLTEIKLPTSFFHNEQILLQFTGLLDRNGKEIYEGDILGDENDVVVFSNGAFCIEGGAKYLSHFTEDIEVIGNVYENPNYLQSEDSEAIAKLKE